MEAEAQCAYLDLTGQTDGTITDDSDIWLFGAKNVYKNFFDQRKFVKQFKSSDIFQCYRLSRDDLIMIALLVGSDYTNGLAGVGPVSAIEIVAHCQKSSKSSTPQSRLAKFIRDYHSSNLSKHLMRKLQSLEFIEGFPSDEVVKAYLSPVVDESQEKFTWAKPDLAEIRVFMRDKFGWDTRKTDKTLVPIFEKLSQSTTQKTIHNYFEWAFNVDEASTVSKRIGNAVEILTTGVVPSPTKKPRREASSSQDETKDRLVSNYTRRKYGRFQKDRELENEPVLEGSRAARAAAKAILSATKKPKTKLESSLSKPVEGGTSSTEVSSQIVPGSSTERTTPRRKKVTALPSSELLQSDGSIDPSTGSSTSRPPPAKPPVPSENTALPALSDILCGVDSEHSPAQSPSLWTPTRDLVSPYVKRKFGRLGQSSSTTSTWRSSDEMPAPSRLKDNFDRIMPSKTPAQIARERAAKKLKETKQKTQKGKKK